MPESTVTLLPTIHRRLDGLAYTVQQLKGLLARTPVPPTHELRLSSKLLDVETELRELLSQTHAFAAVHQEEPRP